MSSTRKQRGGDITQRTIFENIISIGYEIETSSLAKLTLSDEGDKKVLINTDTARQDLDKFKETGDIEFEDEDEEMSFMLRQQEEMEIPSYNDKNRKDKNVSFMITNDITDSKLVKRMSSVCETALLLQQNNKIKKAIKKAKDRKSVV